MLCHPLRPCAIACVAVMTTLVAACGGGGGGSADPGTSERRDLGLVSGTQPSVRTVRVVNPLGEPAVASWVPRAGPISVDPASLPSEAVEPGAAVDVRVVVAPGGPGVVHGELRVSFAGSSASGEVATPLQATIEDVEIQVLAQTLDFGVLSFGSSAVRVVEVVNTSIMSPVTYTGLSSPSPDIEIVDPAPPFVLGPGARQRVLLRAAPYRSMKTIDAPCRLRPTGVQGTAEFTVRLRPTAGRMTIELGLFDLFDGATDVIAVDVPAHVWSFHVSAWRPGHVLPDYATSNEGAPIAEAITPVLFEGPAGQDHSGGWSLAYGTLSMMLPRSVKPTDQLDAAGGTYGLQFAVADSPPVGTRLAVRVVLKATPDGVPPATGTLDLNIWLGSATGLTPGTAAQDATLQGRLQIVNQTFQQIGVTIGDVDYYAYVERTGGALFADAIASIRDALPVVPGVVEDRVNLFVATPDVGLASALCGPAVAYTNYSWTLAGYRGNFPYLVAHEICHYLGIAHAHDDNLTDTGTGFVPMNLMDIAGQGGAYLSPQQGTILRAHPFVR